MPDSSIDSLPFAPNEDPYAVLQGGFYRRWLRSIEDLGILQDAVKRVTGTTDNLWVPIWREIGRRFEDEGDRLEAVGEIEKSRQAYLQAKTYYSIGRFPGAISDLKREVHEDCVRAYLKASAHLDPPLQVVEVECQGKSIVAHYRVPASASPEAPVPAVLIMCGSDVFKEDRGFAGALAVENGLASLVMDSPGTGQNPFSHRLDSAGAWVGAVDWLADRPEVDAGKIGAFGISRGGYWVMHLAGLYPERVKAAVALAGSHFGYQMTPEEADTYVDMRNARSGYHFGTPSDGPTWPTTSLEAEQKLLEEWGLSNLGLIDRIVFMLEHGPVTGKEVRVYSDDGHCAPRHLREWSPEAFRWLAEKLGSAKK
jgi:pimeloyl-ACP methyl ester carboxylesterase